MKLQVKIDRAEDVAEGIRALTLSSVDGTLLPLWQAGAHIKVLMTLPTGATSRAYSLCGEPRDRETYRIAVQKETRGGGGSLHVHERYEAGNRIVVTAPVNAFPLVDDGKPVELVAGGIGVTPLVAMAKQLTKSDRRFHFTIFSRAKEAVPFLPELEAAAGKRLRLVIGTDLSVSRDAMGVLARRAARSRSAIYYCGPEGFAAAMDAICRENRVSEKRLHTENFVNPTQFDAGRPFSIRLASTGEVCDVPAGVSALDALSKAFGLELPCDCRAGYCGTCVQRVLRGTPEHRDTSLGSADRTANSAMCLCVSRARSPEITVDL